MSAIMEEEFSLEQVAIAIIAIRDEVASINKEADKKIKELEREKEKLERYCADKLEQLGSESVKTKSGTIMRQDKVRYSSTNWEEFYTLMKE